jgi:hypothetical protein
VTLGEEAGVAGFHGVRLVAVGGEGSTEPLPVSAGRALGERT